MSSLAPLSLLLILENSDSYGHVLTDVFFIVDCLIRCIKEDTFVLACSKFFLAYTWMQKLCMMSYNFLALSIRIYEASSLLVL